MRKENSDNLDKTPRFIKSRNTLIIGLVLALFATSIGSFSLYQTFANTKVDEKTTDRIENLEELEQYNREDVELEELEVDESEAEPYAFGGDDVSVIEKYNAKIAKPKGLAKFNKTLKDTVKVYKNPGSVELTYLSASVTYSGIVSYYDEKDGYILITIAGVTGWVDKSAMKLEELDAKKSLNHYRVKNGKLYLYVARDFNETSFSPIYAGPAPDYLKANTVYYSQDGHYFYTNLNVMVLDLMLSGFESPKRDKSLNPKNPYYNYFQYLPYRSKTNISASKVEEFLKYKKGFTSTHITKPSYEDEPYDKLTNKQSALYNLAGSFTGIYDKYGINPWLAYGTAVNESAWGRSYLAVVRNNLFGYKAYDSSPGSAYNYASAAQSVEEFGFRHLNWHYLDPTEGNYRGGFLGDKSSGINVKYSSDPYWGMKAAEVYYDLDSFAGNVDYGKESFVVGTTTNKLYLNPNVNDGVVYTNKAYNQSMLILGKLESGGETWYKVAVDPLVESNRKPIQWKTDKSQYKRAYDRNAAYAYVPASSVTLIKNTDIKPAYKRGDLNSDNEIDVVDLAMLKAHLENTYVLKGIEFLGGDINGDSEIDVVDLAMLKAHLEGTYVIPN